MTQVLSFRPELNTNGIEYHDPNRKWWGWDLMIVNAFNVVILLYYYVSYFFFNQTQLSAC